MMWQFRADAEEQRSAPRAWKRRGGSGNRRLTWVDTQIPEGSSGALWVPTSGVYLTDNAPSEYAAQIDPKQSRWVFCTKTACSTRKLRLPGYSAQRTI